MLCIYDQTLTILLNIMQSQTHNSGTFFENIRQFDPLINICKCTGYIDSWRRRQIQGRVSGDMIKNGGNITPKKGGGQGTRYDRRRRHIEN